MGKTIPPDEASAWALQWVDAEDPGVDDDLVWDALGELAGADLGGTGGDLLHNEEDFQSWLSDFNDRLKSENL